MTDVSFIHPPRDRGRINLEEPKEVRFWTQALRVSESRLRSAVSAAGDATPAVRQYLCGDAASAPSTGTRPAATPRVARPQRQQG